MKKHSFLFPAAGLIAAMLLASPSCARAEWIMLAPGQSAGGEGVYQGNSSYTNQRGYDNFSGYDNVSASHDIYSSAAEYAYHTQGDPAAYRGAPYQNYRGYGNTSGYSNDFGGYTNTSGYNGGYSY